MERQRQDVGPDPARRRRLMSGMTNERRAGKGVDSKREMQVGARGLDDRRMLPPTHVRDEDGRAGVTSGARQAQTGRPG